MANPKQLSLRTDAYGNILYPVVLPNTTPVACGSTTTVTAASIAGKNLTNTGAVGGVVTTLPAANAMPNQGFRFYMTVAQTHAFSPIATDKIWLAGSGVVDKDLEIAAVIGNYADLYSDGTDWHCTGHSGVVTKEA